MKTPSYVALSLGLLLILSATFVSSSRANAQVNLNATGTPTVLTIDDVPARVRIGDNVTLSGTLTTVDGKPIPHVLVNIYLFTPEPRLFVVASGSTGTDGRYEVAWNVQAIVTNKLSNDVTKKLTTQSVSLFAQFDGNGAYAGSKTGKAAVIIEANTIKVFVNTDKNAYKENQTAIVFIAFLDSDDKFVDPDSMTAVFTHVVSSSVSGSLLTNPSIPISEQLEKKKVGSYTYITQPLKAGHNQIMVIPVKAGYNIEPATITIIVLTTAGSVGRF